jgi:endo-1,4-beta-xylanase
MLNRLPRLSLLKLVTIVLVVVVSGGIMKANWMPMNQDALPTLRELADRNNLSLGAAVYTYHLSNSTHVETLSREFNTLTPEHEAKHCEIERQRGIFDFSDFDQLVAFAEANDMAVHGHTLVWHSCMPRWIENGDFSREEAIGLLRDYIYTMVGRYKGRIPVWDVVNEGVDDSGNGLRETPWLRLIGDDYIDLAFQFAHEADPDAKLLYNDYGAEGINAKSNAIYELVKDMLERGIPIHGIGLQAHLILGSVDEESIAENVQRFGELGLEVQFTELDVRYPGNASSTMLNWQAGDFRRVMDVCLNSEYCTGYITWGVTDTYTWLRGTNLGFYENTSVRPLLFDEDYQPKPAYFAVLDALARKAGEQPILSDEEVTKMLG